VNAARLILYSFRRCPYAIRARLALAASGLTFELREVLLRDKPPELAAVSAKATVPVLVTADGQVIDESLDIMRWALQQRDPHGWLVPAGNASADMQQLIARCDGPFKHHLDRYKYPDRQAQDDTARNGDRAAGARFIDELEARFTGQGFLCGSRETLAEIAIAPFVRQFAACDAAWFGAQAWSRVRVWLSDFESSADFARVMHKYPQWRAGAAAIGFPPQH